MRKTETWKHQEKVQGSATRKLIVNKKAFVCIFPWLSSLEAFT